MEPVLEERKAVVKDKIRLWENTYYSQTLDVKIAKDTDDEPMVQRAQAQMKKSLRAVALLERILTDLESEDEKDPSCNGGS